MTSQRPSASTRVSLPVGLFLEMSRIFHDYKAGRLIEAPGALPPQDTLPDDPVGEKAEDAAPEVLPGDVPTITAFGVPPGYVPTGAHRRKRVEQSP